MISYGYTLVYENNVTGRRDRLPFHDKSFILYNTRIKTHDAFVRIISVEKLFGIILKQGMFNDDNDNPFYTA